MTVDRPPNPPRPPPPLGGRDNDLLDAIVRMEPRLRKSERKVAALVRQDPRFALSAGMAATAAAAGVSEPTVMRFCQAVGCDGFQTFKLRLAQSVALGMPAIHTAIQPEDGIEEVSDKIFDYTISSLSRVRQNLHHGQLERAIDALVQASRIEFYGVGASGVVAEDAQQKFPLFAVPCVAYTDSHLQAMSAAILGPDDVVVAISNTGRTRAILDSVRLAQEAGATTIGITGFGTPLAGACTIPLLVETPDNTELFTPTTSRVAALVVIDILATGVAMRRDTGYAERMRKLKRALREKRVTEDASVSGGWTEGQERGDG